MLDPAAVGAFSSSKPPSGCPHTSKFCSVLCAGLPSECFYVWEEGVVDSLIFLGEKAVLQLL